MCDFATCEMFPQYGVAPHEHVGIGSTRLLDKSKWPANFVEDKDEPGCGIYFCPKCLEGKKAYDFCEANDI